MTEPSTYPHGHPCWVDLTTRDISLAKAFYAGLFGWTAEDQDTGGGPPNVQFSKDGKVVAGLGELTPQMQQAGVPPVWNTLRDDQGAHFYVSALAAAVAQGG